LRNKFAVRNILLFYSGERYDDGYLEIEDALNEITVIVIKKGLLSKKELNLFTVKYGPRQFPHFEGSELIFSNSKALVENEQDRARIDEIIHKPLEDMKKEANENLDKISAAMRSFLAVRANSIDSLRELKVNPRRAIYKRSPGLLGYESDPVAVFTANLKSNTAEALDVFKKTMSLIEKNDEVYGDTKSTIYSLLIGICGLQDALASYDQAKVNQKKMQLNDMGLEIPELVGQSVQTAMEKTMNEVNIKLFPQLFNSIISQEPPSLKVAKSAVMKPTKAVEAKQTAEAGMNKCLYCQREFSSDYEKCPYCN